MKFTIELKVNVLAHLLGEKEEGFIAQIKIENEKNEKIILLTGSDTEAERYAINNVFFQFCKPDLQNKLNINYLQLISLCNRICPFLEGFFHQAETNQNKVEIIFEHGEMNFKINNCTIFSASTIKDFVLKALDDHKEYLKLVLEKLEKFLEEQREPVRTFSVEI